MSEITVTIDEKWLDELADLFATFDSVTNMEQKELKHRILHTYAAFQSAREKANANIKEG